MAKKKDFESKIANRNLPNEGENSRGRINRAIDKREQAFKERKIIDRHTRGVRFREKLYDERGKIATSAISMVVPLLVFVFVCRVIFTNQEYNVAPETLLYDLLSLFGEETWNVDFLMWTIRNFSEISQWSADFSGIWETLVFIGEVFVSIGNLVLLLIAMILQALHLVTFCFKVLFNPV